MKRHFVELAEWVVAHFEAVVDCMKGVLPMTFCEELLAARTKGEGAVSLLHRIQTGSRRQHGCFLNAMAALKSDLFVKVMERNPKRDESG